MPIQLAKKRTVWSEIFVKPIPFHLILMASKMKEIWMSNIPSKNINLNEVQEGDIIALANAGAYGFTMASHYNSRYLPAEVLVDQGKAIVIRKRETLDDLTRNQVF